MQELSWREKGREALQWQMYLPEALRRYGVPRTGEARQEFLEGYYREFQVIPAKGGHSLRKDGQMIMFVTDSTEI